MFTLDTSEISKINKQIEAIEKRGLNPEGALPAVEKVVMDDIELRFKTSPAVEQGGMVHGGVYWKPLSNYTIKTFNRQGGQILINTGALMRSLTVQGDPYHVAKYEDKTFSIGTRIDYAEKHQPPDVDITSLDNSGNHLYGQIPPRPFAFYHDELINKVVEVLENYIIGENK